MKTAARQLLPLLLVCAALVALAGEAWSQESSSTALVKELSQLLEQAKLDSIAAKDPGTKDGYFAALYFPGSQLLAVGARYQVPELLDQRIEKKEYREVYTDLNSACMEGTKYLVMDIGADGLKPTKDDTHYDTWDTGSRSYAFDGDWRAQKLESEEDYRKAYTDADQKYNRMLTALISQLKKRG
jgi:hypothetical protein